MTSFQVQLLTCDCHSAVAVVLRCKYPNRTRASMSRLLDGGCGGEQEDAKNSDTEDPSLVRPGLLP
jgi:hypothetical protein